VFSRFIRIIQASTEKTAILDLTHYTQVKSWSPVQTICSRNAP
jgi:hypothetical protein